MQRKRKGFTLIELLVVIAIIAILAAILYPVFMKVMAKSVQNKCVSNAKQLSIAMLQYKEDYDGYAVPAWLNDPEGESSFCGRTASAWWDLLQPYTKTLALWSHDPKPGKATAGCSGLTAPANGNLLALNDVVHARNAWSPYGLDNTTFTVWTETFFTARESGDVDGAGDPVMGTFKSWPATLHESQVNNPSLLVSGTENRRASALQPSVFLYRGWFHRAASLRLHGVPMPAEEHNQTATVIFYDGHVESIEVKHQGGKLGNPRLWNNSPYEDGGGWNKNRTTSPLDDVYHGAEPDTDPTYPRPAGSYSGWIPSDQLLLDVSLGGTDNVLRTYAWNYAPYQSIFDEDMTYGEYNTVERPDEKYDE